MQNEARSNPCPKKIDQHEQSMLLVEARFRELLDVRIGFSKPCAVPQ